MEAIDQILELARKLEPDARRRLIERLDEMDRGCQATSADGDGSRYSALLGLAGTVHSECSDLSTNKYEHIADTVARRKL